MRHSQRWCWYCNLKKVQSPFIVLHRRVYHTAVVVIKQEIFSIVIAILWTRKNALQVVWKISDSSYLCAVNASDVHIQQLKGRFKHFRRQAKQTKICVDGGQLWIKLTKLFNSLTHDFDSLNARQLIFDQICAIQMTQLYIYKNSTIRAALNLTSNPQYSQVCWAKRIWSPTMQFSKKSWISLVMFSASPTEPYE